MHTPGPWTHDEGAMDPQTLTTAPEVSARMPDGSVRYICRMFGNAPQVIEESQANARLIAAAPELLSACQAAQDGKGDWRALIDAAIAQATA